MIINEKKPIIISGPCSAETFKQTMDTCLEIAKSGKVDILRCGIWKPRTMPGSFEGVAEVGLQWMSEVRRETGLPIAVEVANVNHVEMALKYQVDVLWIGARTTVNPFSVQEIADALRGVDKKIFIKNPVNPDVALWGGAVERISKSGIKDIGLIHRGFSSFVSNGFRNAPLWHLALEMRHNFPNLQMICDPSHISGDRNLILKVAQQAADLNFDGLMIEAHINPESALSDSKQQVTPKQLDELLDKIVWRQSTTEQPEFLQSIDRLRSQIDQYDVEIIALLSNRMKITEKIGEVKRDNNVTIYQSQRWDQIVERILSERGKIGLSEEFLRQYLDALHIESIRHQNIIMNK